MDFYIQMGHGMQKMCKELLSLWGKSTIIISPLNVAPGSLISFSNEIKKLNGKVLFDPQLYFPRKYHKNLSKHAYWPKNDITSLEAGDCGEVLLSLTQLNKSIGAEALILPSSIERKIDSRWDAVQKAIIERARKTSNDMELLQTISLTGDVLLDETQIENIIQFAEQWDVDGVYIVCEHPERYYLVDKPLWVSNLLALVAGIKRLKKKVIVGYASHQLLCLALSKCDAIAAGNYLNVRWFRPERFETIEQDEISRRAVWYYCPQALSEFKVPFLDIAKRMDMLSVMAPSHNMINQYCAMLFGTGLPSSTGYSEKEAHRHYLHCLRLQCLSATQSTYIKTRDAHLITLETAEQLLSGLRSKGIRGQDRDFGDIIDVNRAAIAAHDIAYQYPLSKEWALL